MTAPRPSLSIQLPSYAAEEPISWVPLLDLARLADRVGVDRIAVSDHVVFGEELEAYADPASGGITGGTQPTGPDGHWLEPLTLLSVIAGSTSTVRLSTAILLAALRRPAVLAKQLATLDVLSGGRVDLGVGIGWQRQEYEATGLDFTKRGRLLDHSLAVCQTLWTERSASFDDDYLSFERIHAMPKPLQPGGVPVWVSGRINPRTVERLVRFGKGWIPWGDHRSDPASGITEIRAAFEAAGRDPEELQVQGTLPSIGGASPAEVDKAMAGLPARLDAGVTDFRLHQPWGQDPSRDAEVLEQIVPAFRAAVGR